METESPALDRRPSESVTPNTSKPLGTRYWGEKDSQTFSNGIFNENTSFLQQNWKASGYYLYKLVYIASNNQYQRASLSTSQSTSQVYGRRDTSVAQVYPFSYREQRSKRAEAVYVVTPPQGQKKKMEP